MQRALEGSAPISTLVRILAGLLVLMVLAVSGIAVAAALLSADAVRSVLVSQTRDLTGMELAVDGESALGFFPTLNVSFEDVRLVDPASGEPAAEMRALVGSVRFLPLLAGRIEVDSVTLENPRILLAFDAEGRANWSGAERGEEGAAAGIGLPIRDLSIEEIRIVGGAFDYRDAASGTALQIGEADLTAAWPALNAALTLRGSFAWRGERVEGRLSVERPLALADGAASAVRLRLNAPALSVSLDGTASGEGQTRFEGDLDASTSSMRRLAGWVAEPLEDGATLGPAALRGRLLVADASAALSGAAIELDGNRADGALSVDLDRAVPLIQATLDSERLDLSPYIGGGEGASDAPLNAESFARFDADMRLSASKVLFGAVEAEEAAASITLRDGLMEVNLGDASVFGGEATGTFSLAPWREGVRARLAARLQDFALERFLSGTFGLDRLTGAGSLAFDLSGAGTSWDEIRSGLAGDGRLSLRDGALEGIALAPLLDSFLAGGRLELPQSGQRTVFESGGGTFSMEHSVLSTDDLALDGPLVRIALNGDFDLAREALAMRGRAGLKREGEVVRELPFTVSGPLARPSILPDIDALLPEAGNALGEVMDGLRRGDGSRLRSLFDRARGRSGPAEEEAAPAAEPDALDEDLPAETGTLGEPEGAAGEGGEGEAPPLAEPETPIEESP